MKKIIGIVLLIAGIFAGYQGYKVIDDSSKGIEIGDLEIKAEDSNSKANGYLYFALGAVGVIGGIVLLSRKN